MEANLWYLSYFILDICIGHMLWFILVGSSETTREAPY